MLLKPFSFWWTTWGNKLIVNMAGRDEHGKKRVYNIEGTEPFFFVLAMEPARTEEDGGLHPRVARIEENAARDMKGRSVHKVVTYLPSDVPKLRDLWHEAGDETMEADVEYGLRTRYEFGVRDVIEVPEGPLIRGEDIKPVALGTTKIKPRVLVFDIETSDKLGFSEARNPTAPVLSIAAWDSFSDRYVCILNGRLKPEERDFAAAFFNERAWKVHIVEVDTEAELFAKWQEFVEKIEPDILTGWNSAGFDVPYLQNRAKNMKYADIEWRNYVTDFDLMEAFVRVNEGELDSKGLDFVSQSLGLPGKLERGKVYELYENDRGALLSYNANDTFLTKEIMLRKNLVGFFDNLCAFAGLGLGDVWNFDSDMTKKSKMAESRLIDAYMFHRLRPTGVVQPTKGQKSNYAAEVDFRGGKAIPPQKGLHRWIVEIDNTGEYANQVRAWNMSPETRVNASFSGPVVVTPLGNRYRTDVRGIIPQVLDELIDLRYKLKKEGKKEEERVVKEVVLSFFGTLGNRYYRNGDVYIAADITDLGRRHQEHNRAFVVEQGAQVLRDAAFPLREGEACDVKGGFTDAVFFSIPLLGPKHEEFEKAAEVLAKAVNTSYNAWLAPQGVTKHELGVKVEHVYETMLLRASENNSRGAYACLYRDPKGEHEKNGVRYSIKVRGFELRRSDSAPITRTIQKEVLRRALMNGSNEGVMDYVRGVVEDLKAGKIPTTECRIAKGLKKAEYEKNIPQHVKAAFWSNKFLGKAFKAGDKPVIYFVERVEGKPPTDCIALEWKDPLPPGTEIDWKKTLERVVIGPLSETFDTLGLNIEEILNPTYKVEEFF